MRLSHLRWYLFTDRLNTNLILYWGNSNYPLYHYIYNLIGNNLHIPPDLFTFRLLYSAHICRRKHSINIAHAWVTFHFNVFQIKHWLHLIKCSQYHTFQIKAACYWELLFCARHKMLFDQTFSSNVKFELRRGSIWQTRAKLKTSLQISLWLPKYRLLLLLLFNCNWVVARWQ
jgi:hypothetical protein